MLPGFIDPHLHVMFSMFDQWLDLGPFANSNMDEAKQRLIEAVKQHKNLNVLLVAQLFDPQIMPG